MTFLWLVIWYRVLYLSFTVYLSTPSRVVWFLFQRTVYSFLPVLPVNTEQVSAISASERREQENTLNITTAVLQVCFLASWRHCHSFIYRFSLCQFVPLNNTANKLYYYCLYFIWYLICFILFSCKWTWNGYTRKLSFLLTITADLMKYK